MYDNEQYFFAALQAGACGYVLKSAADEDLVAACRTAIRGESFLYAGVTRTLVRDFLERMHKGGRVPHTALTPREDEIVKLIAEGPYLQGDRRRTRHQRQDGRTASLQRADQARDA